MKKRTAFIIESILICITIIAILYLPYIYGLISIMVSIIFPVEVFVRRPANKKLGHTHRNLGGGYQSGGRLPNVRIDKNAQGSGGINASGTNIGGASGGGFSGNDI